MSLQLVQALTRLSWANTEAADQTNDLRILRVLEDTARAADEAARHVQFNRRDLLTERQLKLVASCEKNLQS